MNYKKFEDFDDYIIFKTGEIYSLRRNIFLKSCDDGEGYLVIGLYKEGQKKQRQISIHRLLGLLFIPNPENKPTVDHINNNRSDNRLINLRWATIKEQADNKKLLKNNTSGFKGVDFDKGRQKWRTRLSVNGKRYQRLFKSKEEAIAYRRVLEIKLYGEDYII